MNKDWLKPTCYRLASALLLAFFVTGCSALPWEIRHDTSTRTYTTGPDGNTKTYTTGQGQSTSSREPRRTVYRIDQYADATAYYILREGNRPASQPGTRQAVYRPTDAQPAGAPDVGDMPLVLEVTDVLFDFDKATLRANVLPELDQWAKFFIDHPDVQGEIQGHADSTGPSDYNLGLSRRRAQAVVNYLVQHGVATDQLTAKGFGESQPVAPNTTSEGRQKNRRVELDL